MADTVAPPELSGLPPAPGGSNGKTTVAWVSLGIAIIALGLKYAAWACTGSIALKSDALETIINVVAAIGGLWAIKLAERPADDNHTYGHYKAEYLSAIIESAMVLVTAFAIGKASIDGFLHPVSVDAPWPGLALNGTATILNLIWGYTLLRIGRAKRSPALVAGGQHVLSDVWTGFGLIAGLALIPFTGWHWLDPTLAALVAVNVLRVGWEMLRQSVAGLMDEAPDPETLQKLREVIAENATGALEAHDIRTREVGAVTFIEFHLVVPGSMTVAVVHEICDRIEAGLRRVIGRALINIHVEPEYKAKNTGIVLRSGLPKHQHS
ncbi:cation diffusion facilitator family transporter [Acetobacter fallax]|uniref:Cation diffusion facilitator family transporter n=1 Tax=Acetobacter fallax TaxID=1737473 RepID=A0ABX0KAI4_9PROT|nr:cation diffusion facilitator family transporter [Acetobacter fallax]NHO32975.1 cation diffusion facilitator family transporter [Acetobacter fallax]NHO36656.1 cation diffusion facilitator family transporter [Acetobacter fallax]